MRPIKFRAWDSGRKEMFDVFSIQFHTDVNGNPWRSVGELDTTNVNAIFEGRHKRQGTDYVLMQFTGLHDKSGKEIWEGDIVKLLGNPVFRSPDYIAQVIFDSEQARFSIILNGCQYAGDGSLLYTRLEEKEVIGNIYENPELLRNGNGAQN